MTKTPIWTFIFIGICVIAFIFQSINNIWIYLSFIPAIFIEGFFFQIPWIFITFITSIFLHVGFYHLFGNMFFLFFFGMNLERVVGRRTFFSIFILSGIVGNIGYLLTAYFTPYIDLSTPGVGASGAIYGIMGTLVVLAPLLKAYIFGLIPVPLIILIIIFFFQDFFGLFAPSGIAHGAHLGGLFVGIAFGFYIRRKIKRQSYYQD